jgi:hypothetical protein
MDFPAVLQEVVREIKRPEKANSARREINAAVTFYCLDNLFQRDFVEQNVAINATQAAQAIAISSLTRMRHIKYIKRGGTRCFLKILPDSELFNSNCDLRDRYYIVGDNININMATLAPTLDIGYYSYPPLLNETTQKTFWLLDVAPYMVIDRACAALFKGMGDEKSFQTMRESAREGYLAARKDLGIANQ